jgi:acyl-CoA reductase-like NAD-dependent aldehyde dehydrogenase
MSAAAGTAGSAQHERVAADTIRVTSPATGEFVADVPVYTREQVREAVALAREAQRSWAALSFRQRGAMLKTFRDALLDRKEEVALTVCAETGKPEVEVYTAEIFYVCDAIGYWAKNAQRYLADRARTPHLLKTKKAFSTYKPRGVIGLVTPWNYPFQLTVGEAIPALMAGNAVVIKPSEVTPLSCVAGCGIAEEAGLPRGLLSAVTGYARTGQDLVDFADMIAFTGSVATGRKIAMRCAELLKPCSMELGGKDPMIVCRDADLERAANAAVWGSVTNAGQVCMSVERIYVDEKIHDRFVDKVVANVGRLRQGPPEEHADLGSMTSPPQIEKVEDHLRDATAKGARVLAGGKRAAGPTPYWMEPTVVVDVTHDMKLMRDETFGPVIAIQKVKDEAEALRLANDSSYGLSASVWSMDKAGAMNIARRIEAGAVCVNDHMVHGMILEVPMGGTKESGLGRRHGREGITKFCEQQTIVIDRFGGAKELFWYPSSPKLKGMIMRALNLLFHSSWRRKLRR